MPYSKTELAIFKSDKLAPVKDLKLLIKDYTVLLPFERLIWYHAHNLQPIAKNALTILINISSDRDILKNIVHDDAFLESLLLRITVC